jgi:hypothetical protein
MTKLQFISQISSWDYQEKVDKLLLAVVTALSLFARAGCSLLAIMRKVNWDSAEQKCHGVATSWNCLHAMGFVFAVPRLVQLTALC